MPHGDHMPPNKVAKVYVQAARRGIFRLPYVRQAAAAMGIPTGIPRQRYYPQVRSGGHGGRDSPWRPGYRQRAASSTESEGRQSHTHPVTNLTFTSSPFPPALCSPRPPPAPKPCLQCAGCSQKQASAIRNDKTVLVFHEVLHRGGKGSGWHYAGVILGLRHLHTGSGSGSGRSSGGGGSRRRVRI